MDEATGLATVTSRFGVAETISRLKAELAARGQTLFAEIDHAAGAASVGLVLRPTTLLIFGNAKAGTKLMQADQRVGIDLPLKALVWEDESGLAHISHNLPSWVAGRYGISDPVLGLMENIFQALTGELAPSE